MARVRIRLYWATVASLLPILSYLVNVLFSLEQPFFCRTYQYS